MANKRYFDFIEIEYDKLTDQINQWLRYTYSKADIVFNSASAYGQIVNVVKELFQQNLLYLKNAMKMLNIKTSTNKKVIQSIARIAGHNPGRAISATGTLKFKLKPGIDYNEEIKESIIIIENKLKLKNINNSLSYVAKLNQDENIYSVAVPNTTFYLPIIQGVYETQTFTGDGTINQSFSVNIPNQSQIENFTYIIRYNSTVLEVKDSLYDMLPKEMVCVVKSGFDGGIDIYFGTDNFGFVPQVGSYIEVEYLLSDGSMGEILNPTVNEWKIEGEVKDGQGNIVGIDKLFDIYIHDDINFASDGESIEFTKAIVPYVSRNFVLATPKQFIFHLKRMNLFSKVNAYNMLEDNNYGITDELVERSLDNITKSVSQNKSNSEIRASVNNFKSIYNKYKTNLNDNMIFLYLIPDITKYFNDGVNYFNIPFDVFYLDEEEQEKTLSYLRTLGTMSITTSINIIQPKITRYIMHIYVRRYDDAIEENIKQEMITKTSQYLLKNTRFDRIPKSDFIELYKDIEGIDSVSLFFVSEKNENKHRVRKESNVISFKSRTLRVKPIMVNSVVSRRPLVNDNNQIDIFNPNEITEDELFGIDKIHGDILIENNEYAIIRGGFKDRNDIWYSEDPNDINLNSINITFDGVTKK